VIICNIAAYDHIFTFMSEKSNSHRFFMVCVRFLFDFDFHGKNVCQTWTVQGGFGKTSLIFEVRVVKIKSGSYIFHKFRLSFLNGGYITIVGITTVQYIFLLTTSVPVFIDLMNMKLLTNDGYITFLFSKACKSEFQYACGTKLEWVKNCA
jgi:hypothetical protein